MKRLALVGLLALLPAVGLAGEEKERKNPWDLKMFRVEFDNDTFVGSDDVFTAGWSLQLHSRIMDRWNPAYAGWIGRFPGLGDDGEGGRVVRWAYGLSQIILTPSEIGIETPQPDDVPWAGTLGVTGSWWSNDNKKLAALQIYLGCLGPCSQAEQVQTFVHDDLGFGEPPKGWDNQLSNRVLANLNYEYRYKLYAVDVAAYLPGRFAHDLSIGGQAAVGNLLTSVTGQLEFRFGWGLTMGFTKVPDPPGLGIVMEPIYFDPGAALVDLYRWRIYFNVVARSRWTTYFAPAEGGATESGYHHPALDSYPGENQILFGLHLVRVPVGFHFTYYRYLGSEPPGIQGSIDWINFSLEYRF